MPVVSIGFYFLWTVDAQTDKKKNKSDGYSKNKMHKTNTLVYNGCIHSLDWNTGLV